MVAEEKQMPDLKARDAHEVRDLITAGREIAIIDLREMATFGNDHMLFSVPIPLSRLEMMINDMVPRRDTPIVLVSAGSSDAHLIEKGASRLKQFGYSAVSYLKDGMVGWRVAGLEAFSGVNVPSKAFGEFIEHTYDTPRIPATELNAMMERGDDFVVLDSRPMDEYEKMNIPHGVNVPGAELVHRVHDMAPNSDTTVVVNCAGRTRSIIGAQSLINAGIANRVVALENGTMGWHLSGLELEYGKDRVPGPLSAEGREQAKAAAEQVRQRFGVRVVDRAQVEAWRAETARTTYLLDVRSPEEFKAGHMAESRHAPGGQLVQAWDRYVGVQGSRLVLIDDDGVRATMTASWMIQMGWDDVYVLAGGLSGELVRGAHGPKVLGLPDEVEEISVVDLKAALQADDVQILDLGDSLTHRDGHIAGSRFAIRASMPSNLDDLDDRPIVLTSSDGVLARLAAQDLVKDGFEVRVLSGGTAAWINAGEPLEPGFENALDDRVDVWYRPYDMDDAQEGAMKQYLSWEVGLVQQVERDGTTRFRAFP